VDWLHVLAVSVCNIRHGALVALARPPAVKRPW